MVMGIDKLCALAERHARDDADGDIDFEKWGHAIAPGDVVWLCAEVERLRAECHGRRFDPNLIDRLAAMTAARDELADIAERNIFVPVLTGADEGSASLHKTFTVTIDTARPYREKARVAELRKVGRP